MEHIKLYEAFSEEFYKKAMNNIKDLVSKDTPKEDILKYISIFSGDNAESLDNIRLIIERTAREFNRYIRYVRYREVIGHKTMKRAGKSIESSGRTRHWKKGDTIPNEKYSIAKYYIFNSENHLSGFLERQKSEYDKLISSINMETTRIKFFCDRFFEILKWCSETGYQKYQIWSSSDRNQIKTQIEELNDFDMENEVEEIKKLTEYIKRDIMQLLGTIG